MWRSRRRSPAGRTCITCASPPCPNRHRWHMRLSAGWLGRFRGGEARSDHRIGAAVNQAVTTVTSQVVAMVETDWLDAAWPKVNEIAGAGLGPNAGMMI